MPHSGVRSRLVSLSKATELGAGLEQNSGCPRSLRSGHTTPDYVTLLRSTALGLRGQWHNGRSSGRRLESFN